MVDISGFIDPVEEDADEGAVAEVLLLQRMLTTGPVALLPGALRVEPQGW